MRSCVQKLTAERACKGGFSSLTASTFSRRLSNLAAVAMVVALSACASKPEIALNSYCELKATELIDLRDPGLQRLTPVNQGAVLTGDDSWNRFCKGAVNKGR